MHSRAFSVSPIYILHTTSCAADRAHHVLCFACKLMPHFVYPSCGKTEKLLSQIISWQVLHLLLFAITTDHTPSSVLLANTTLVSTSNLGKSCQMKWFHLTCLGMSKSSIYRKESGFVPYAKISSDSQSQGNLHATTSINFNIISVL